MKYSYKNAVKAVSTALVTALLMTSCAYNNAVNSAAESTTTTAAAQTAVTSSSTTTSPVTTTTAATTTAETTATEATTTTQATEPAPVQTPVTPETSTTVPDNQPTGETVTVNGIDYTIADSDIKNEDGNFVQDLASVEDIDLPDCLSDKNPEIFLAPGRQSNPSLIPYSQITFENAAQAFPYLGWKGYVPDYIEITPDMNEVAVEVAIMQNLYGEDPADYYSVTPAIQNWKGETQGTQYPAMVENAPEYFFSSEADYDAWRQKRADERAEFDAALAHANERIEAGDYTWLESDEELAEIAHKHGLW